MRKWEHERKSVVERSTTIAEREWQTEKQRWQEESKKQRWIVIGVGAE